MLEKHVNILQEQWDDLSEIIEDNTSNPAALIISESNLIQVLNMFHTHDLLYFDMLSCITGIDNPVAILVRDGKTGLY